MQQQEESRRRQKAVEDRRKGEGQLRRFFRVLRDEQGIGVVEMILILVVLIGLVIIFKEQLTDLVNSIFKTISSRSGSI